MRMIWRIRWFKNLRRIDLGGWGDLSRSRCLACVKQIMLMGSSAFQGIVGLLRCGDSRGDPRSAAEDFP